MLNQQTIGKTQLTDFKF